MEEKTNNLTPQQLVKLLSDNSRDEQGMMSSYLSLLDKISTTGVTGSYKYQEVVNIVKELVKDEMKHIETLTTLIQKFSGITPAQK